METYRVALLDVLKFEKHLKTMEMNLHMAQSVEAAIELRELVALPKQIVSVRENKPVILPVQDAAVGVNRLTRPEVRFAPHEMMNLMMFNDQFRGDLPEPLMEANNPRFTGAQVVSQLLSAINLEMKNKMYDEKTDDPRKVKRDGYATDAEYQTAVTTATDRNKRNLVKIKQGVLEQGMLDKDTFGKGSRGIVHLIYNYFGRDAAVNLIDSLQNTVSMYLVMRGFSVGISDLIADEDTRSKMADAIEKRKTELQALMQKLHSDMLETHAGTTRSEELERKVFHILNQATDDAGDIGQKSLSDMNRMINMVRAGSKGSKTNVSQMIAIVGQQNVEGKRMPYGFTDRTLPHFKRYDDGARARGFVENSFISGLSPEEFYFHAMSGREGLIDTAVKSITGDTHILIIINGKAHRVMIGDWIDQQMAKRPSEIHHEDIANLEQLHLEDEVYVSTCDSKGNTVWGEVTSVTRHDPGEILYEVETYGGRIVKVTASKSLIIWNGKIFKEKATPDIVIGDCIPVSFNIQSPPNIQSYIDMTDYFPKTTDHTRTNVIYGSEFEKAKLELTKAMDGRKRIPEGWWETNNGTTFILPYRSKALFQRAAFSGRSKSDNVLSGYIYPYAANREPINLPERFNLNYENGVFIGLYLADGNSDIPSGYIQITKKEPSVKKFVGQYFDKMGMKWKENVRETKMGTITDIRGYSRLFGQFLTKMVGKDAYTKHIPYEAYTAPDEFVIGLLSGYFSGDGTVGKTAISASSVSSELIEGISYLCNRIGIFGKISKRIQTTTNLDMDIADIAPIYVITMSSHWARQFADKVKLISTNKQANLDNISTTDIHKYFDTIGDVVLDKIVKITKVSPEKYPKAYDLTVPSTGNFGLANGEILKNTADTGYLQRQLVKAMEDLVVQHDYTVRDAAGVIVQYTYGEDRMNGSSVESQELKLLQTTDATTQDLRFMKYADVLERYGWRDNEAWSEFLAPTQAKELQGNKTAIKELNEWCDAVRDDQHVMLFNTWGRIVQESVLYPVNLSYLINQVASNFALDRTAKTDLSPLYVARSINAVLRESGRTDARTGEMQYNRVFGALMHYWCSPRRIVKEQRFTRKAWDYLIEQIRLRHADSIIAPGEMCGVIAAQSIGEPSTQIEKLKNQR